MHGVAPNADIVAIAYNLVENVDEGTNNFEDYVINSESTVINMSFGSESTLSSTENKMKDILNDSDIGSEAVLVAATGNSRYNDNNSWNSTADNPEYPARYASDSDMNGQLLAVAALNTSEKYVYLDNGSFVSSNLSNSDNINNNIAYYSNYCGDAAEYCLAAPGGDGIAYAGDNTNYDIYSAYNNSDTSYAYINGTSMAAPHVAGAAAIIHAAWPSLTGSEVVDILLQTAEYISCTDLEKYNSNATCTTTTVTKSGTSFTYNDITGWGSLDLYEAVQNDGSYVASSSNFNNIIYSYDNSKITVNSNIAQNLFNSSILEKAVFFDRFKRDYKANFKEKILVKNIARQKIDFNQETNFKNLDLSNNLNINFIALNQNQFLNLDQLESTENQSYQVNSFNIYNDNFGVKVGFHLNNSYSNLTHKISDTDQIFNFYQKNRIGISFIENLHQNFSYKFSYFKSENDINEFHNIITFNTSNVEFDMIYSFINSNDKLLGIEANEAFTFGNNNKHYILGFNLEKLYKQNFKLFFDYRHLFVNESNNNLAIFRNLRSIEENSIAVGFNLQKEKNNFEAIVFFPNAIINGELDINIAVGRDKDSIIRAEETIKLATQNRQIDYSFAWQNQIKKDLVISFDYNYKDNFNHIDGNIDQVFMAKIIAGF